jgi:SAM-dependent methyltransferase
MDANENQRVPSVRYTIGFSWSAFAADQRFFESAPAVVQPFMNQTSKPRSNTWDASLYESDHAFVWKHGAALLPLLHAQSGERIVDLGCGTGQLTSEIAATGAETLGIDSSPDMIGQARQNYPKLKFQLADARSFLVSEPFDAVFSNAALHWIPDARPVAQAIFRALKPGGRFVAEFGGKGNTGQVMTALEQAGAVDPLSIFYYPSVGEYSTLLESEGFEVRLATLFDRPTELADPVRGLEQWLLMFLQKALDTIPAPLRRSAITNVEDRLRAALFYEGKWHIDYRRLRVIAVRL